MSAVFNYINLVQYQKSKTNGIVNGIIDAIEDKAIEKGDPLPSVNRFIQKLGVARMTVVKALNTLKEQGIIVSEDKVGYFVRNTEIERELKVMLFLSGFQSTHETVYNQIIEGIGDNKITVDLFFHHYNPKTFNAILKENIGLYGLYIISVFDDPKMESWLNRLPKRKLLQILRPPILNDISYITQDFYNDLKIELFNLKPNLKYYDEFILVFPSNQKIPKGLKKAFIEFCSNQNINYSIVEKVSRNLISPKKVFGVIEDKDLISVIQYSEEAGYRIGHGIGVVSYNETPMKKIIKDGITVISADFFKIGDAICEFIQNPKPTQKVFSPKLITRNSV